MDGKYWVRKALPVGRWGQTSTTPTILAPREVGR